MMLYGRHYMLVDLCLFVLVRSGEEPLVATVPLSPHLTNNLEAPVELNAFFTQPLLRERERKGGKAPC